MQLLAALPTVGWQTLGSAVTARRVALGYDRRDDFAAAKGMGSRTLGEIERGEEKGYRQSLLARLEKALEWPPGTIQAILGGEPAPGPDVRVRYDDPVPREPDDLPRAVSSLGGEVDAWLHPDSDLPEPARVALRQAVRGALDLAVQAAVAAAERRGWPAIPDRAAPAREGVPLER
jgi:transcriptional regulator with XRE-family HTH domain